MVRYSIVRLLVFFGCLAALWLLGLRSHDQLPWLVVIAALLSMLISWFALRPMREQATRRLAERVEGRHKFDDEHGGSHKVTDEDIEDAEDQGDSGSGPVEYR